MYATVRITLPHSHDLLAIPATALINTREGLRVASIDQASRVHLLPVVVARDTGSEIEVAEGLREELRVVQNPGAGLSEGLLVAVEMAP
jgi:multidrug efflux pump subunit AcrA (membrane-fusion protein)